MIVEVLVLSGARQGEVIELLGDRFRIGTSRDDDIYFSPLSHPTIEDRSVIVWRDREGWALKNNGKGDILIKQRPDRRNGAYPLWRYYTDFRTGPRSSFHDRFDGRKFGAGFHARHGCF